MYFNDVLLSRYSICKRRLAFFLDCKFVESLVRESSDHAPRVANVLFVAGASTHRKTNDEYIAHLGRSQEDQSTFIDRAN